MWIVDPPPWSAPYPGALCSAPTWPGGPGCSYCAAHSRFFRGLRLHLIATPGLPITWALAPANRLPDR